MHRRCERSEKGGVNSTTPDPRNIWTPGPNISHSYGAEPLKKGGPHISRVC